MKITKIKNTKKELYRKDDVSIQLTIKGKRKVVVLTVDSINGEVDLWDAKTRKDTSLLLQYGKQIGAGWDNEIYQHLSKHIPQP